jgi:hypothetical protein
MKLLSKKKPPIWAPGTDHPAGLPSVSVSSLVESIVQHQPLGRILAFDHTVTASSKNPFLYEAASPSRLLLHYMTMPILVLQVVPSVSGDSESSRCPPRSPEGYYCLLRPGPGPGPKSCRQLAS